MRKPVEKGGGKIEFSEKVRDTNGRNIFIKGVNLKSINGDFFNEENPNWINWKVKNDKIEKNGDRLKTISLEIDKSRLNENVNYVFELVSSNGKEESIRKITVNVISTVQKEFNTLNNIKNNFKVSEIKHLYLKIYNKFRSKKYVKRKGKFVFNRTQNQFSFKSPNIFLK